MFNIIMYDEEPAFLENLSNQINEVLKDKDIVYSLMSYTDRDELLSYFEDHINKCDVLLLDVLISRDSGMEVASRIRKLGYKGNLILISSSTDYLIEGYQVEPLDFLIKPIDNERLEDALMRAYKKTMSKTLILQTASSIKTVPYEDILYMEIYNKTLTIHTYDDLIDIHMTLSAISEKLPESEFVKCHRGYIVAYKAIQSLKRYEITLKNKQIIPVSKLYYKNVQEGLLHWAE